MLFICIYLAIFVLILFSIVFNYHERKFEQDLLSDKSLEKFRKIKVSRLELKRYVKNTYLGSNINMSPTNSKRREINLESPEQNKIGMFNTLEDELTVYAYIKKFPHVVFTCPYSKENKELLKSIVKQYNDSSCESK
jgi:hypothetical protein